MNLFEQVNNNLILHFNDFSYFYSHCTQRRNVQPELGYCHCKIEKPDGKRNCKYRLCNKENQRPTLYGDEDVRGRVFIKFTQITQIIWKESMNQKRIHFSCLENFARTHFSLLFQQNKIPLHVRDQTDLSDDQSFKGSWKSLGTSHRSKETNQHLIHLINQQKKALKKE